MKTKLFTISVLVVSLALMPGASGTLAQGLTPFCAEEQGSRGAGEMWEWGEMSAPLHAGTSAPLHKREEMVATQQQAQNVELVGQIGGVTDAVAVQGNYAYIGVGPRLVILDVSDPANSTMEGQSPVFPGIVYGVVVTGGYAYVANADGGLRIVNVIDPAHPTEVGFYDTPGYAHGVVVAGTYAYVADYHGGLRIVNVSDPAHPVEVGFYDTPGYADGVAVAGTYAYVADEEEGLRIVNVADPAHPAEVGFCDTPGQASGVAVAGTTAYVADGGRGLRIINVADPAHPVEVGFYGTPGWGWARA